MGKLVFIGDIPMSDRIKMLELFEPYAEYFGRVGVLFCNKMRTTLGRANYTRQLISLNARLLKDNPKETIPTFVHELAHLLADKKYDRHLIKPHGREWGNLMREMGEKPERAHRLDVSKFKRRHKRVKASCECQVHMITMRQVNKIDRGAKYRCIKCNTYLKVG